MTNLKRTALVLVSLVGILAVAAFSQANEEDDQRRQLVNSYRATEGPIVFYGKVVDQHGNPVEGASVDVSVPAVSVLGRMSYCMKTVQTDAEGGFEVSSRTYGTAKLAGRYLYVKRITKDGFEGDWVRGSNSTFSFATSNAERFIADASRPVVYTLRKKGASTFLLESMCLDLDAVVKGSGSPFGYDFVRGCRIGDAHHRVYDDKALFPDLQVTATFNTNDATWTVVLSPGDTNGGIVVSEQLLYEAPEIGYQPEYTFTPEDRPRMAAKYVYLKSRDPAIYTRLEIEHISANPDFFRLSGRAVTNPYGDRNLEQATDLTGEVMIQLNDEAKTSFRQNKRPARPDIPKLIREGNERAKKDKGSQLSNP